MPIYHNHKEIGKIYRGSQQISNVYNGDKLVFTLDDFESRGQPGELVRIKFYNPATGERIVNAQFKWRPTNSGGDARVEFKGSTGAFVPMTINGTYATDQYGIGYFRGLGGFTEFESNNTTNSSINVTSPTSDYCFDFTGDMRTMIDYVNYETVQVTNFGWTRFLAREKCRRLNVILPECTNNNVQPGHCAFYSNPVLVEAIIKRADPTAAWKTSNTIYLGWSFMFQGNTNLRKITVNFTSWPPITGWLSRWCSDMPQTDGTFYKPSALPAEFGEARIPTGWNVINIDSIDEIRQPTPPVESPATPPVENFVTNLSTLNRLRNWLGELPEKIMRVVRLIKKN